MKRQVIPSMQARPNRFGDRAKRLGVIPILVLTACAVSHSGAEFSGIWEGTVEERGKVHRFELRLEVGAKEDVAGHLRLLSEGGPDGGRAGDGLPEAR